jgi:hypothetical protein
MKQQISAVSNEASNEATLEVQLRKIQAKWAETDFEIKTTKEGLQVPPPFINLKLLCDSRW